MAAVGVVLLMAGTSAAVVGFFRARPGGGSAWQRAIAPTLATLVLVALVVLLIGNFDALLGTDPTSPLRWILPGLVLLAAVVGAIWAVRLKSTRPDAYAAIGTTGGIDGRRRVGRARPARPEARTAAVAALRRRGLAVEARSPA